MIPIDLCITLSGPNVEVLWKLFINTMIRCCNLDNVVFHIINKDVEKEVLSNVKNSISNYPCNIYQLPFIYRTYNSRYNVDDVAYTCDYKMKFCGVNQWVCISHFDLWFNNDWLSFARAMIADDVAIIGNHCPIMLVNRHAYKQTKIGFASSQTQDTAQLLQNEMYELGWKVLKSPELNNPKETLEAQKWFHHIGGGGTHYNEPECSEKFKFVSNKLKEFNI